MVIFPINVRKVEIASNYDFMCVYLVSLFRQILMLFFNLSFLRVMWGTIEGAYDYGFHSCYFSFCPNALIVRV